MAEHIYPLNRHQREWLTHLLAGSAGVVFSTDVGERWHASDVLWTHMATLFAAYTVRGDELTAEFTLPLLRIAYRYRRLCWLAYQASFPRDVAAVSS